MNTVQIILIFAVLFLAIGCLFGIITITLLNLNNKVLSWSIVKGEIVESVLEKEVEKYTYDTDEFNTTDSITYKSNIKYSYSYNGGIFESKRIYASNLAGFVISDNEKKRNVKDNPVGKKVQIYVNPNNPLKPALINRIPIIRSLVFSTVFLIIGVLVYLFKTSLSNLF